MPSPPKNKKSKTLSYAEKLAVVSKVAKLKINSRKKNYSIQEKAKISRYYNYLNKIGAASIAKNSTPGFKKAKAKKGSFKGFPLIQQTFINVGTTTNERGDIITDKSAKVIRTKKGFKVKKDKFTARQVLVTLYPEMSIEELAQEIVAEADFKTGEFAIVMAGNYLINSGDAQIEITRPHIECARFLAKKILELWERYAPEDEESPDAPIWLGGITIYNTPRAKYAFKRIKGRKKKSKFERIRGR